MKSILVLCVATIIPYLASAQQQRPLRPQEVLNEVPGSVTSAQDREIVRDFLDEKAAAWKAFAKNTQSACSELLAEEMSVFQFAGHLDAEEARAESWIDAAYARLRDRLSSVGLAELDADSTGYFGYAIENRAIDFAAQDPETAAKRYRVVCLTAQSTNTDPSETAIAVGPGNENGPTTGFGPRHPLRVAPPNNAE